MRDGNPRLFGRGVAQGYRNAANKLRRSLEYYDKDQKPGAPTLLERVQFQIQEFELAANISEFDIEYREDGYDH